MNERDQAILEDMLNRCYSAEAAVQHAQKKPGFHHAPNYEETCGKGQCLACLIATDRDWRGVPAIQKGYSAMGVERAIQRRAETGKRIRLDFFHPTHNRDIPGVRTGQLRFAKTFQGSPVFGSWPIRKKLLQQKGYTSSSPFRSAYETGYTHPTDCGDWILYGYIIETRNSIYILCAGNRGNIIYNDKEAPPPDPGELTLVWERKEDRPARSKQRPIGPCGCVEGVESCAVCTSQKQEPDIQIHAPTESYAAYRIAQRKKSQVQRQPFPIPDPAPALTVCPELVIYELETPR